MRTVLLISLILTTTAFAQPPADPVNFFPILTWDLPQWSEGYFTKYMSSLPECGFNTAAFVRPQHLPDVDKYKLKCILAPKEFPIPWRTLSDEKITATVKKMVDEAAGNPSVIGFFLADEPGAPDFPALGKAVAAVKKLAPGKLAYINLFPDYATIGAADLSQLGTATYTQYLERYIKEVDPQFISYDNYRIQQSHQQKVPAIAVSYFANLVQVRQIAQAHHLPFWNIVESVQLTADFPPPSPATISLEAFTTLAAGAKGLTWYTYFDPGYRFPPIEKDGRRTPTFAALKMINEQVKTLAPILAPLTSTGVYFTAPAPAPNLPALPGKLIDQATGAAPLMIGEFSSPDGHSYALIVNTSVKDTTQFTLKLRAPAKSAQIISSIDASTSPLTNNSSWLTPGQGVLLKIN